MEHHVKFFIPQINLGKGCLDCQHNYAYTMKYINQINAIVFTKMDIHCQK